MWESGGCGGQEGVGVRMVGGSGVGVGKPPFFKSSQAQVKSQSQQFGHVKPQVKSQGQNIFKSSRKVKIFSSQVSW